MFDYATACAASDTRGRNSSEFLQSPTITALKHKLDAIGIDDPKAVLDAAMPYAQDTSWLEQTATGWLDQMGSDPLFMSPLGTTNLATDGLRARSEAIVFTHPRLLVSIASVNAAGYRRVRRSAAPPVLAFSGQCEILRVIGTGEISLQHWTCARLDERTDLTGDLEIAPGDLQVLTSESAPVQVDGRAQTYTIDDVARSVTLVRFSTSPSSSSYSVTCDADHKITGIAPVHRRDARVLMYAEVLRALSREDRGRGIEAQLHNQSFFVRSQMARELAALEGVNSLPALREAARSEPCPSSAKLLRQIINFLEARKVG